MWKGMLFFIRDFDSNGLVMKFYTDEREDGEK